jgi:hypothetical protein
MIGTDSSVNFQVSPRRPDADRARDLLSSLRDLGEVFPQNFQGRHSLHPPVDDVPELLNG